MSRAASRPRVPGRAWLLLGVLLAGTALVAGCSSGGGTARPGAPNRPQTAASTRPGKGPTTTAEPAVTAINTEETAPLLEPGDTSNKVGGPSIACRVSLTGDLQAEFNGYDDQTAFSSDYYLSDAELNAARSTPRSTVAGIAAPTLPPGAAPVAGWFILTCQGGDVTLSLTSDPRATVDEVPFGPGTYRVGIIRGVFVTDDVEREWAPVAYPGLMVGELLSRDRHPDWMKKAEPAVRRVAEVWATVGLSFPLDEVMEAW